MPRTDPSAARYSWIDTSKLHQEAWLQACPAGHYAVMSPGQLPDLFPDFPQALLDTSDSVLLVASGSAEGITYYMVNVNRVDNRDRAIDQEPFGLAFFSDGPAPSGCFIHHGDWYGRTEPPPPPFWDHILASGLGTCYPLPSLPTLTSGLLGDLEIRSQQEAFRTVIDKMRITVLDDPMSA